MKKIITITAIMATSLLFTACGGGGGGAPTGTTSSGTTGSTATSSTITPLSIGVATPVAPGYKVVNSSEDAVVDILVSGENRTMVLKSGSASLSIPN